MTEAILASELSERVDFETVDKLNDLSTALTELGHDVVSVTKDEEHGLFALAARSSSHGKRDFTVNFELIQSVEFRRLRRLRPDVGPLMGGPLSVSQGDEDKPLESKEELLEYLMESGKKGLTIQRYKGLGEMNPDQLWETTMDPERRSVLEVRLEDAAEADMLFSVLMGDAVEPRRQFIEEHALDVQNLDV